MPEVDLLNFKDVTENGPHTKHLVKAIFDKALRVGEDVKKIRDAVATICLSEDQLSVAYKTLSDSFRITTVGNPTINEPDDEFKQYSFQFCSFMDELTEIHHSFSRDLQACLLTQLDTYVNKFGDLSTEASNLDNSNKACDQAFQSYMKLSKKSPYKLVHNTLTELAMVRRDFQREACIHYGHLNEAGYLREIAPLLSISVLLDSHTQHVNALNQVFGKTLATYLTAAQAGLRRRVEEQQDNALDLRSHVNNMDFEPLSKFCPEPGLLDTDLSAELLPTPNTKLHSKSGRLLMRSRAALLSRWIEVYCFTQTGNLMSQQYGELGASLLIDLNQKGVYAESTDCDDRRNVFQIVSPTEHKSIILQAESELERDEWIHTLTNVIFQVNRPSETTVNSTAPTSHGDNTSPVMSSPKFHTAAMVQSPAHDSPVEWSASCLPPVRFELPPVPELNTARDTELLRPLRTEAPTDVASNPADNVPSGSTPAVPDVVLVPEELPDPLEVTFLGAVDLPDAFESMDPVKLNDLFSYVLSCRSASTSPEPHAHSVLITKRDVWLLTRNSLNDAADPTTETQSAEFNRGDVLVRVPFVQLISWLIYPENPRLACLLVQGPLKDTTTFADTSSRICFAFEANDNQQLAERLLAAQLERIDLLQEPEHAAEREILLSNISRLSEAATFNAVPTHSGQSHGKISTETEQITPNTK